ncbi:bag family molecular chaperone regulator 4 [Phtheirospermum japonicum]|uniref:Bag family molecular chaperone regulator 4 n=1 Tax=Phtheirospermum japonicum TaxID=374723 RepID=A0A830BXC0_9LAMI|nr:bag family molecular chaperone regulator 4 [Phtheirospermum japonicum]
MKGVNPTPANAQQNGGIGPEMKPEFGPSTLNVKVSHGLNEHEVAVPSTSTFGDLKSIIVQKIGLSPDTHKLLFRGKEKEDDEDLQTAGVKDNSKLLLMEDTTIGQNNPEKVMETSVISRGSEAVAQVREEVDKLADKVSAVQAVVDSGTKIDNKDILYLTEMLMRQLLKLDGIDAEGEGKVQRKMEVRRVQSFVDTMDIIKSRNSNPFNNAASVTTQWETFEPSCGNVTATSPAPLPSHAPTPPPFSAHAPDPTSFSSPTPVPTPTPMPSSTKVTQDWEHFD